VALRPFCVSWGRRALSPYDRNLIVPVRPKHGNPVFEAGSEQYWVDGVDQCPQPAHARRTEMKRREQKIQMLALGDDIVEISTRGHDGADHKP